MSRNRIMSNGRKIAYILIAVGLIGLSGLLLVQMGVIHESMDTQKVPDIRGMELKQAVIMLYSSDAGKYDRTLRFVKYDDSKPPIECEPITVETDRMEDYVVKAVSPEVGTSYHPDKDILYLAVEDRLTAA